MSSPFVAEIRMFSGNFAPKGWAQCNGQLLPISQNTALFSLLGFMGLFVVLGILFIALIYREIQHGPHRESSHSPEPTLTGA